jgi:hypothetical protein
LIRVCLLFSVITTFLLCELKAPDQNHSDREALLAIHEQILEAHRMRDVALMMSVEGAETVLVASRGNIHKVTKAASEQRWQTYFSEVTFSTYHDLQPPIVTISKDGTLGWLMARVEIVGERKGSDGLSEPIHDVWAWIELYEKRNGRWVAVGNVSNVRPGESN